MSRFGIRKRLKGAIRRALGAQESAGVSADAGSPVSSPSSHHESTVSSYQKSTETKAEAPAPASGSATVEASVPPPAAGGDEAAVTAAASTPSANAESPPDIAESEDLGRMWVQAGRLKADEVLPGSVHSVDIFGRRVAVYKAADGTIYASDDSCPHAGGPLGEGELDGHTVTCPFHGFQFDIRDGSCTSGQELSVRTVQVKMSDGLILLEVSP